MSDRNEKDAQDEMDQELVNQALNGDPRALEMLVEKYKKRIY